MRARREVSERVAEINTKILYHRDQIEKLEAQKTQLLNPPVAKSKVTMKMVMDQAKKQYLDPELIAKKLKLTFEDDTQETAKPPIELKVTPIEDS